MYCPYLLFLAVYRFSRRDRALARISFICTAALYCIFIACCPNLRLFKVCSICEDAGVMQITMEVRELPERELFRILVSVEFLKGMCLDPLCARI